MYKYLPLTYFDYNRPYYFGATLILGLFGIFYIILYLVFKYEYYNRLEHCDPMFYYGQACRNKYSKELLFNPKFLDFKKKYYELVSKYNAKTGRYEGILENTQENKETVENSNTAIEDNIKSNKEFGEDTIDEIKKITTITNLITTKYLGNLEELLANIQNAPAYLLESLKSYSFHLAQLRNQLEKATNDPYFRKFTSPLSKLYKSLVQLDKKTQPYLENTNEENS